MLQCPYTGLSDSKADALTEDSGERSPLARLYELDGHVLLLGVEHWNNTSLHLAEFRADYPGKRTLRTGSAMLVDGRRQWVTYETLQTYGDDFGEIGAAFDAAHEIAVQKINEAEVRFFRRGWWSILPSPGWKRIGI